MSDITVMEEDGGAVIKLTPEDGYVYYLCMMHAMDGETRDVHLDASIGPVPLKNSFIQSEVCHSGIESLVGYALRNGVDLKTLQDKLEFEYVTQSQLGESDG